MVGLTFLICDRVAPMVLGVGDWSLFRGYHHNWTLVTGLNIFVTKIPETANSFPFRNFLRFSISHYKFVYGFQIFLIDFRSSIGFIWTLFLKYFWTWDKIERRWKWIWFRICRFSKNYCRIFAKSSISRNVRHLQNSLRLTSKRESLIMGIEIS